MTDKRFTGSFVGVKPLQQGRLLRYLQTILPALSSQKIRGDNSLSALKFLFSTQGRVTRLPFILFVVGLNLILTGSYFLIQTYFPKEDMMRYGLALSIPAFVTFITLWPAFAVTVKRLHDVNWSAFPALGLFIPIVVGIAGTSFISFQNFDTDQFVAAHQKVSWVTSISSYYVYALLLVLSLVKGTKGQNRYGSDPLSKGGGAEAAF
ncbi:DUF805 domain-containing protein [Asticcacaulis sp. SL142]|uniref:DUF805 domain-containing protein n=1 Tax=Asticcacaulis sp. SL142 TaxID=2995155 RepID=UPI00226D3031|nr:DUF805 domain-containing protein [Asticcacaulis sp. SL142]WAC48449.1 DUF805 domain-containing protein [Asticcacaulis sp. SL142]